MSFRSAREVDYAKLAYEREQLEKQKRLKQATTIERPVNVVYLEDTILPLL